MLLPTVLSINAKNNATEPIHELIELNLTVGYPNNETGVLECRQLALCRGA